jgi:hypothetical protein
VEIVWQERKNASTRQNIPDEIFPAYPSERLANERDGGFFAVDPGGFEIIGERARRSQDRERSY